MKRKISDMIISLSFLGVLIAFSVANIILPDKDVSYSERRKLAELPKLSYESVFSYDASGKRYFDNLEEYLLDQFPARDAFRTVNVSFRRYGLMQKDVDGIYVKDGKIFKLDYTLNEKAVERTADVYLKIIDR